MTFEHRALPLVGGYNILGELTPVQLRAVSTDGGSYESLAANTQQMEKMGVPVAKWNLDTAPIISTHIKYWGEIWTCYKNGGSR